MPAPLWPNWDERPEQSLRPTRTVGLRPCDQPALCTQAPTVPDQTLGCPQPSTQHQEGRQRSPSVLLKSSNRPQEAQEMQTCPFLSQDCPNPAEGSCPLEVPTWTDTAIPG